MDFAYIFYFSKHLSTHNLCSDLYIVCPPNIGASERKGGHSVGTPRHMAADALPSMPEASPTPPTPASSLLYILRVALYLCHGKFVFFTITHTYVTVTHIFVTARHTPYGGDPSIHSVGELIITVNNKSAVGPRWASSGLVVCKWRERAYRVEPAPSIPDK